MSLLVSYTLPHTNQCHLCALQAQTLRNTPHCVMPVVLKRWI